MKERRGHNPKRKIAPRDPGAGATTAPGSVVYTGNPQHKKFPEDYGLTPPSDPRPDKTLCDAMGKFPKRKAESLLTQGLTKGMISVQVRNGWPQNIWAVDEQGIAFEAQLENEVQGHYHGYPMPKNDALRDEVRREWAQR